MECNNEVMGSRSFSLVDQKIAEAEFFLGHIRSCGLDWFATRCFCSAFAASARSITFTLQAVMAEVPDFPAWYESQQNVLKSDPVARFFHEFRTVNQHIGDNLVNAGVRELHKIRYYFTPSQDVLKVPEEDVATACEAYFKAVLTIVYRCYEQFGPHIDAHQRYTAKYFESLRKTIDDAEEELGFPRGWTDIGDPNATAYRWQALRQQVAGCEINALFAKYLGRTVPTAERLPPYKPGNRRTAINA